MKIKDIKKYVIWFILWLSLVGWLVFAADNWSIGALFENSTWPWRLKQEAIKDNSIEWVKLKDWIDWSKIADWTIWSNEIASNSITNDKIQSWISEDKLASWVQSKLNSSIDWKDVSVNNLTVSWTLNWFKFVKEFWKKDENWYTIADIVTTSWINKTSTTKLPSTWKYITNFRLSWTSSPWYWWACLLFVKNKIAYWLTTSYWVNINKLSYSEAKDYNIISIIGPTTITSTDYGYTFTYYNTEFKSSSIYSNRFWYNSVFNIFYNSYNNDIESYIWSTINPKSINFNFDTIDWYFSTYNSSDVNTLTNSYNYWWYIDENYRHLEPEDEIYIINISSKWFGWTNADVRCKLEVQYSDYYLRMVEPIVSR